MYAKTPAIRFVSVALVTLSLLTASVMAQENVPPPKQQSATQFKRPPRRPSNLPPGVLAEGTPPLTEAMVSDMALVLGRVTGSPFTLAETERLRERTLAQWQRGGGYRTSIVEAHERMQQIREKVASFPPAAQPQAWLEQQKRVRAETLEHGETYLAESFLRATRVADEPLVLGETRLNKNAAQAYFEMREYFEDTARGRIQPMTPYDVLLGGNDVARLFETLDAEDRRLVASSDVVWAVVRAALGTPLTTVRPELRRRVLEAYNAPGGRDLTGRLTPSAIRRVIVEQRLHEAPEGTYWSVPAEVLGAQR